jgi:hypothetical protein
MSQTNFFLTRTDLLSFERALRRAGDFTITAERTEGGRLHILDSLSIGGTRSYLVRPQELAEIRLQAVPTRGYELVDAVRSSVVEFDRPYHGEDVFRRGRIYVQSSYFEGEVLHRKDEDFLRWTTKLMSIARRKLKKDPASFFYYGEEAWQLRETSIEFA